MFLLKTIVGEQVRCEFPKTFMLMKGQKILKFAPEGKRFCITAVVSGEKVEVIVDTCPVVGEEMP